MRHRGKGGRRRGHQPQFNPAPAARPAPPAGLLDLLQQLYAKAALEARTLRLAAKHADREAWEVADAAEAYAEAVRAEIVAALRARALPPAPARKAVA